MSVRTTKNPVQALERLAAAAGWKVKKVEGGFAVHTPGVKEKPIPKKSTRALAFLAEGVRRRDDWQELRAACAYDPGIQRGTGGVAVPVAGISSWEETALTQLAVTEV